MRTLPLKIFPTGAAGSPAPRLELVGTDFPADFVWPQEDLPTTDRKIVVSAVLQSEDQSLGSSRKSSTAQAPSPELL